MGILILLLLPAMLLLLCYLYYCLRFHLPPGPRPFPIVGNLFDLKPVRFRCYAEWAESYGPIISVWFGSNLNVVVSNAELAKQVLKEKDQQLANRYRDRPITMFSRDGQDLIWADYGPHYVKVRKMCMVELFSPKRLEALRPIREDEVAAMVASIYNDCSAPGSVRKKVLLRKYVGAVAFNYITRLTYGKRFMDSEGVLDKQGQELRAIFSDRLKLGASLFTFEHIPWLRWMFPLDKKAFAELEERRYKLTHEIMEEHTLASQKGGEERAKQNFCSVLFSLREKYDLSNDTIVVLLWDMITAWKDTIEISVEWAMAELLKNPRVMEKAQEELDRAIGSERVMNEEDISSLPYLQCVA